MEVVPEIHTPSAPARRVETSGSPGWRQRGWWPPYGVPVPRRPDDRARQLLDAQVRYHLDRLAGDELASTVARLADELLTAADRHPLEELVERDTVKEIVVRAMQTVPGSAAVGGILELATTVLLDGPAESFTVGDAVERERVEVVVDRVLALSPLVERMLERLVASPLVGTAASRFTGRIVGEVLQANRAVADKVPGLGALMSFGTSAASKVVGAADKQFEGLIGDTVGRGGTFAVRRLNKIVVETLRDPTTREAVLQVWDLLAEEEVVGLERYTKREELTGLVDAGHEVVVAAAASAPVAHLVEVVVDAFFDRFGGYSGPELLAELALDRADLVDDLVRLAPPVVAALRESGDLERLLRAELEPFYASAEVKALLGGA